MYPTVWFLYPTLWNREISSEKDIKCKAKTNKNRTFVYYVAKLIL